MSLEYEAKLEAWRTSVGLLIKFSAKSNLSRSNETLKLQNHHSLCEHLSYQLLSGANAETILAVLPAALTGLLNFVEATDTDASFSSNVAAWIINSHVLNFY